jgi:hypothetical protein
MIIVTIHSKSLAVWIKTFHSEVMLHVIIEVGYSFAFLISFHLHSSQLTEALILSHQDEILKLPYTLLWARCLVEGVGAGSPVGEEQAKADGLENTGNGTDSNGVERTLLGEDLGDNLFCVSIYAWELRIAMTYRWCGGSHEDQWAEVSSALVGEGTGSVDQSTNTVCLDGRADNGATPGGSGGCGLLAVEVLLLGVGLLRAAVGITEDGAEDGEGDSVVEGRAKSNGRGLDGRKVW